MEELIINYEKNFELIFIFLLGIIIGSFLNTVTYRLPIMLGVEKKPEFFKVFNLFTPRSHCEVCKIIIPFYFNIPVASYLILKRRCFNCKSSIPCEYAMIELLTGLTFLGLALSMDSLNELIFMSFLCCSLIVLAVIDLKYLILPNYITYSLIFLGLLINLLFEIVPFSHAILGCFLGYSVFFLIEKFFYFIKQVDGLGRGDAKLIAAIGAWMGLDYLPLIIFIAACLGIIFFIITIKINKKTLSQSKGLQIPFGTFLAISCIVIIPITS